MDIWCIGDLNYFVSVLNGLAMLSNVGLFNDLIKLGLILAVLVIGFQAMFQTGGSGGIPWGRFILAFIAFKFLFGTVTTVHVNDTYTLQSLDVDNVPYGVAVTGSIMSKVAHEITDKLEQAFSLPHMTETGFAGTLETLAQGRKFIAGLDTLHSGKITKTLVEYCDKCTSAGINKGELDLGAIKTAPDPWNSMKWNSDIYYAMTWLPSDPAGGTVRSCTEAWEAIDNYLRGQLWSDWNNYLSSQICNAGAGTCDPVMTVQSALDSLLTTSQDARNYILAAVLLPAFEQGQIEFNSFMGKPELSVIVGQAREQRNIQWQAEGSLFMNIARPMMAFFEGFLYAITPFMALLVAFVPAGLSLVGKYFMMFLWVQLWMPIMAILNHHAQIVAQQKLAALIGGNIPLTSLQGHLMGVSAINDWLGTAGVLVASTPAISLALLFGGAITMTHLAGRLQHGDMVNEKIGAPDVVQPSPALALAPGFQADPTHAGAYKTGSLPMAGEINVGDDYRSVMNSALQLSQTSGIAFGESLRQTMSAGRTASSGLSSGITTHNGRSSAMTTGEALTQAYSEKLAHASNLNAGQTQQLQGMLTAGLGGGAGAGLRTLGGGLSMFGADGNVSAEMRSRLTSTFGDQKGMQLARQIESDSAMSGKHDLQAVMQDTLSYDASRGQMANYLDQYDSRKLQDTQAAGKRHYDAQKQYSEASQKARFMGGSARMDLGQSAKILQDKLGSGRDFADKLERGGVAGLLADGKYHEQVEWAKATLGVTSPTAEWVGLLRRLDQMGQAGNVEASQSLVGLREQAFGIPAMNLGNPQQHKDIVKPDMALQGDKIETAGRGLGPLSAGEISGNLDKQRHSLTGQIGKEKVERDYMGHAVYISRKGEAEAKNAMLTGYRQTLKAQEDQLGPLKSQAHNITQKAAGAFRALDNLKETGWHGVTGGLGALQAIGRSLASPADHPLPPGLDPYKVWNENRAGFFESLKTQGKAMGYSDALATVYAQSMGNVFASALHERYPNVVRGADALGDPGQNEKQAIAERSRFFRTKFNAEDARTLAEREVALVKMSGMTGGLGYASAVGHIGEQLSNLEQNAQSGREQILLKPSSETPGLKRLSAKTLLSNREKYGDIIDRASKEHGVDASLIRAVIQQESGFDPEAVNPESGATGLMQLMKGTAGNINRKNAEQNIMRGTAYLREMLDRYHGNERLALAAYNAGPDIVDNGKAMHLDETRKFIPQVLAYRDQYASVDTENLARQAATLGSHQGKVDYQEIRKMAGIKDHK